MVNSQRLRLRMLFRQMLVEGLQRSDSILSAFRSRWEKSKSQFNGTSRGILGAGFSEGMDRSGMQRGLRFENLETRNLMAAWVAQGPFSATNGQVENIAGGDFVVGAIHAVLAHPTDANVLYVGATNGGVWKTTNAMSATPNWTTNTDSQSSISIGALAFDLADTTYQTLWAGNGRYSSFGQAGGARDGLLKSIDGGANWTRVTGGGVLDGKNISGIVANGKTIVVSVNIADVGGNTNVGIFRSTNGGATFTQVNNATSSNGLPFGRSYDLVADPLNASILYTSNALTPTAGDEGIYKSTNGGGTWTRVSDAAMNNLFANNTSNVELAAGRFGEVYAAIINAGALAGLYRSPNRGVTWTAMDLPATNENGTNVGLNPRGFKGPLSGTPDQIAGGQGNIHFSIAADPTNANIVYVGGDRQPTSNGDNGTFPNSIGAVDYSGRLFRGDASRPLGSQFVHLTHRNNLGAAGGGTANSTSPHADSRDMVIDANGNLIETDDGGIYRRTNPRGNGGDWFSVIGNLQVTEMHDVAYDTVSNVIVSGNQDTGTTYQPLSGARIWDSISTADGGDVAVDEIALSATNQSIRYSSFQNLGNFTRSVYDASGAFVSSTNPTLTLTGGGTPLAPTFKTTLQANAVAGSRLIIQGGNSIYESLDQGATISEVGPGFGGNEDAIVYGGRLNGVNFPDVLWVGAGNRVALRSTSNGSLTLTPSQPTAGTIRDLVVDPNAYTSVAVTTSTGISWSTNAGTTWRDITGNLSSLTSDFRSLAFVPDAVGTLIAGTAQGIFGTSMNTLGLWFRLGSDFPNVPTYEIEYDAADDLLVAGTLGRGAWSLPNASSAIRSTDLGIEPPRLLSISSNSGKTFDPNAGNIPTANVLNESPRELVFRFSGSTQLDATSLSGIRIVRTGGDDLFNNGNDVVVTPTYIGFGDTSTIVIARFGDALPDDRYRIEVFADDVGAIPAVQTIFQQEMLARFAGTDRDTYYMNLELGAKIVAVVPQPVTRLANGTLQQAANQIEVYFNDDNLDSSLASNRTFYQLILTNDSVTPNDDSVSTPLSVNYEPALDKATLTFASDLNLIAGGNGTFRLRIGSNRTVATSLAPQIPNVSNILPDVGDTLSSASTVLGTLNSPSSRLINTSAVVTASNQLNLPYPGSNFEPGHRDIQDESHLEGGADGSPAITKILYNFSVGRTYGAGSNGQPLYSSITPDQKQRVREIFEFYSAQAGIDVVETDAEGYTIVVGDLFPLNNPPQPFTPAGIAGGGLAIMNGALSWNNGLGENFFDVALHEIGHLLGLGHTYELPSGTVMGSTGQLDSGNPIEFFFPGDQDVAHLQHLHRPDNRDVDIFKFDIQPGQKGKIQIETIAERLSDSSDLDTYLTLFKRDATGLHIIAINDNYFSEDSLIRAEVTGEVGTEYFIAVTSRGNENFDPKVTGSGSGGTSQGNYQLRVDYLPSEVNQILDTNGTALDGDGDGISGGEFNFWFKAVSPVGVAAPGAPKTIFVDKDNALPNPTGALNNPYTRIQVALAVAQPGDVIRLIGSSGNDRNLSTTNDNRAYEFGDGGPGKGLLSDGPDLTVPKGVTLMIDAGAILKLASTEILVGSDDASNDRAGAAIQVLGTPTRSVIFTSHFDQSLGIDTNLLNTTPARGQWGGIEIRNDVDRAQGRHEPELDGIFLNYIGMADIRYGGGAVGQGTQSRTVNPIHLTSARPTLLNNKISQSADAGISADPNSFEETLFTESRYQFAGLFTPDYSRIGPDIQNQSVSNSSINGLFIRIDTLPGNKLKTLSVAARLNDTGIVYVLGENLIIEGTPGGSFKEVVGPDLSLVTMSPIAGGALTVGATYQYRLTEVDQFGQEGLPSAIAPSATIAAVNRTIVLNNLPTATGDFVGRRLYRKLSTSATWDLVAELNRDVASYTDLGNTKLLATGVTLTAAASLQRARRDASLVIDPGVVMKLKSSRIEVGMGASLIAEGTSSKPVIFTSRQDDRYGAGVTFDTNNDQSVSTPLAGDWSGIYSSHLASISIDSALITFGGGASSIAGGFATFNAIEVNQGTARIANSVLENNARGNATAGTSNRDFHGPTDASVIHVVNSQPVIFNNIIRNNNSAAAISIDAGSLKAISVRDNGRATGANGRSDDNVGNQGPFVVGNELGGNLLNGMVVRGATLTTESIWDDTDIVHILQSEIVIPDFHTFGGLLLQSKVDESLVVKLSGPTAGFTASGRPLDIPSRIGGSLQVVGAPGFPVILTSLSDDSAGAGFDWQGHPMFDTNNNGLSIGTAGDWRSVRLNPYSNDRNVETTVELEADPVGDKNRNDLPANAQNLGTLASNLNGGDENIRLGFTVHGTVAVGSDLDVYSFTATSGTSVWFDIDRTGAAFDSVIELVNDSGRIIAQSDNSYSESLAGSIYSNSALVLGGRFLPMNQSSFVSSTNDFQTINPLDAGMRIQLPGVIGTTNKYYIRVRSSNLSPTDLASKLQDLGQINQGLTVGSYRLQVRLQQQDEVGGSTVRYADVRYATTGIEVLGLPGHSPLVSETSEDPTSTTDPATAQDIGNVANSDRAAISASGTLNNTTDADWYRFRVFRDSIQSPGSLPLGVVVDVDYADGLGRPDATLWVYRVTAAGPQLVLIGTDSNIADDRAAPVVASSSSDLSRGSFGPRDPFIGVQELPDGEYLIAITPASRVEQQFRQFSQAAAINPLLRLEPVSSVQRISEDHFETANLPTQNGSPAKQVAFAGNANAIPFNLSDVTLFVSQTDETVVAGTRSRLLYANPMTGAREAELGQGLNFSLVNDIAVSPAGVVVGAEFPPATIATKTDANTGFLISLNDDGSNQVRANAGIQTYEAYPNNATFQVTQVRTGANNATTGIGIEYSALSFVDTAAAANPLALFAVGSRSDGLPFDRADFAVNGTNIVLSGLTAGDQTTAYKNILYRVNPDTLTAISPPNAPDRAGDRRARGTGTDVREYGVFAEIAAGNYTRDLNNNQFGDNIIVTRQAAGTIVGLAQVGDALYGVTDQGELWRMNTSAAGFNTGFVTGATLIAVGTNVPPGVDPLLPHTVPVGLTGLSRGPRNVEGGVYANTLFGISATGEIFAFDISGAPQNVFPGAAASTVAAGANGLGVTVNGLDFAALDVNMWHTTAIRGNDAGHGRPVNFDATRNANQAGTNSLYFGYEPTGVNANAGIWTGIYAPSSTVNTYDFAGGASGAIESNSIDLREYSVDDKPMLYFTYRAETENSNGPNTDNIPMSDAFRVYGLRPDGTSVLLATNNATDDGVYTNSNNEFDPSNAVNADIYGRTYKPQTLFDANEAGDTGGWRQARIPLAALAGLDNVRLRFEFSTGGSFQSADPLRGGIELTTVAGSLINDGDEFTIIGPGPSGFNVTNTFEFDLGLVLNLPSAASIIAGNQIIVQGRAFTFQTTPIGVRPIVFSPTDTPAQIAVAVSDALIADGFSVATNAASPNIINIRSGTRLVTTGGPHNVVGLDPAMIIGRPGVTGSNVAVPIDQSMDAATVRDAVRTALASAFNRIGQEANTNVWKFYNNTLQLYNYTVDAAGPLALSAQRTGDTFGARNFSQASLRASNNANQGIFVDDIIIAMAERGEMVVNAQADTPVAYQNDPLLTDGGYTNPAPIPSGTYQIEIRTAADYLDAARGVNPITSIERNYDSNDRLAQQVNLIISGAGDFKDGDKFDLSDGINVMTFEFNVITSLADRAATVTAGNVPLVISPSATAAQIATVIRNAINSSTVQQKLKITAGTTGDMSNGAGGFLLDTKSAVIQLHGLVSSDLLGNLNSPLAGITFQQFGQDSLFGEDLGDGNRRRDQGQIIITSNTVRNSQTFGIVIDDAIRDQSGLAQFVGDRPYPGSVRNLITTNTSNLAPGVVVSNNIVATNATGGILISGDNTAGVPNAASNIARVYNNTVFGGQSADQGIRVEQGATATLLNNILTNLTTGITLAGAGATSVLGANIFQSNGTNVVGGGTGTFPIILTPNDPLFVDVSNNRFYLENLSQAIDSSLGSLAELGLLSQVKNSVFLPVSPLIAPDRDVTGILRIDDRLVDTPAGSGLNVNIDRGAVERADSNRLNAYLVNPLDNDSANIDVDRTNTFVRLLDGSLDSFSILLSDDLGSGPNASTVLGDAVIVTENGKKLIEGIDYTFGFNSGNNTIKLTPLSGLWRRDSVYEISLVNKPTYRIDTGDGTSVSDGERFSLTLNDGTTRTFEYESGFVLDVPFTLTAALADGQTITYQNGSGSQTFEFNLLGNPTFNPSNTIITVAPSDTYLTIADKIEAALATVVTGGAFPVNHVGSGRVHVGGSAGDQLTVSNRFVSLFGQPGVTSGFQLTTPINGGAGIADGERFSITSASGVLVTFEFDSNGSASLNTNAIAFSIADTDAILASKIAAAISASSLGLTPTTAANGVVVLNEPRGTAVNLLSSSLTLSGVSGGAVALPFVPWTSFSSFEVAAATIRAIDQLGLGINVFSAGSGGILIEGISGISGSGTSALTVIRDIAGNTVDANRTNSLTQFTIVMPEVVFDFGDAPGTEAETLLVSNGARNAILPPDAPQLFLGARIDVDADGQPNANATGDDLDVRGDDEDGVLVEPGLLIKGFFNPMVPNSPVTITSSGAGFVDAWIDWNRDGDFTDLGEQVITNEVVTTGSNTLTVTTPTVVSVGLTTMRVRLSQLGNLLSGGVGIGGEVEDHQVEIISNIPPVAMDDSFTVVEDNSLPVNAPGILTNDFDTDGGVVTVFDFDGNPLNGIQPSVAPLFGSLVLNADGSFTYTPNQDFVGIDTFSYYAFDSVLNSLVPATVTIQVLEFNDPPEFTLPPSLLVNTLEDGTNTAGPTGEYSFANFATSIRPGPIAATSEVLAGQTVQFTLVAKYPNFFADQPAISSAGTLSFRLNPDVNRLFATGLLNGLDNQVVVTAFDDGIPSRVSLPQTFSIDITPENDAPIANGFFNTVNEDSTTNYTAAINFSNDFDGPVSALDELVVKDLTIVSVDTTSANGGVITPVFLAGPGSSIVSFSYKPANSFVGLDRFTYTILDNEGGNPKTAVGTVTIDVTPINDAPIITLASQTVSVSEDQGSTISPLGVQTQVPITIAGFAFVAPGPIEAVDEVGQNLSFTVEVLDANIYEGLAGQPKVVRSLTNPSEAILSFTLSPHANRLNPPGSANRVRVSVQDSGNGVSPNVNTSAFVTFTIDIAPVNDPPIPAQPLVPFAAVEDTPLTLLSNQILFGAKPGPALATDEASQTISITSIDSTATRGTVIAVTGIGGITSISYQPPNNYVGPDSFTYTITDDGGGTTNTAIGTVSINVAPVNDAPIFTPGGNVSVEEDAPAYSASWATGIAVGPANAFDELNGDVSLGILAQTVVPFNVSTTSPQLFLSGPSIDASGVLSFQVNPNVVGDAVVMVSAVDSGSNAAPNVNRSAVTTFTISINPINDAPVFIAGGNVTTAEDTGAYSQPWATGIFPAAGLALLPPQSTDESGQSITFFVANNNSALFSSPPAISPTGVLTFTTAPNAVGFAEVTAFARDGGLGNFPHVRDSAVVTFTINLTPLNDAPVFVPGPTVTVLEDSPAYSATWATGIAVGPASALDELNGNPALGIVAQTMLPFAVSTTSPQLFLSGPSINAAGVLSFQLRPNAVGDAVVSVSAVDSGASVAPNVNRSAVTTFTISITPVNDAPIFTAGSNITVSEDIGSFSQPWATGILPAAGLALLPPQSTDEAGQTISFFVANNNSALFSAPPAISPNGVLTFTSAPNAVGIAEVTVFARDNGMDTPPNIRDSAVRTFTINLTPVNDAPVFVPGPNITVNEDAPAYSSGWATGIATGPSNAFDELNGILSQGIIAQNNLPFVVTTTSPQMFLAGPSISATGVLSFQLKPNANGDAVVTVAAVDSGSGVAPNVNRSAPVLFTISVTPVNDAPIPATRVLPIALNEDTLLNLTLKQVLDADLSSPATPGPADAIDEASQTLSITRVDGTSLRGAPITVIRTSGVITGIQYQPLSNFVGADSFTYTLTDNGGGTTDSATGTISINVVPINDAPLFTPGANVIVAEDSPVYSAVWATGISVGPANALDELNGILSQAIAPQTILPFNVTTTSPELFQSGPSINAAGVLTFQLKPNAVGDAVVSVSAVDSGASNSPNVNQSAVSTFTISITAVNDAPIFTSGGDIVVDEDSGPFSAAWATRIFPAGGLGLLPQQSTDESGQTITFIVTSNNSAMFSSGPAISPTGVLSFTPALNKSGAAVVTAFARDNGSGVAPNVRDSVPVTFTINLTAFNDAPIGADDNYSTTEDAPLISTANQEVVVNDFDPDGDRFFVVAGLVTSARGALINLRADGSFIYDPRSAMEIQSLAAGQSLNDTFTYRLRDQNNEFSAPVTVTVTVSGFNDAPQTIDDPLVVATSGLAMLNVLANDVDVDSTINPGSLEITLPALNGSATALPNGMVSYSPNLGYRGTDSFSYRVRDNLGAVSRETTVQLVMNAAPVASPDSAVTTIGTVSTIDVVANDSDPDVGDTLNRQSVSIISQGTGGNSVVLANGDIQFTPNANFVGLTTITYTVQDSGGMESNVGTLSIQVVPSLYQNPRNRFDVNNDGIVAPVDALIVINHLNTRPTPPALSTTLPKYYLDVDGSQFVTPLDVLQVINFINTRGTNFGGEGENGGSIQIGAQATPNITSPAVAASLTSSFDVEVLDQPTVQAYAVGKGALQTASKVAKSESQEVFDLDNEWDDLAADINSDERRRKSKSSTDSVFANALDDLGIS